MYDGILWTAFCSQGHKDTLKFHHITIFLFFKTCRSSSDISSHSAFNLPDSMCSSISGTYYAESKNINTVSPYFFINPKSNRNAFCHIHYSESIPSSMARLKWSSVGTVLRICHPSACPNSRLLNALSSVLFYSVNTPDQ